MAIPELGLTDTGRTPGFGGRLVERVSRGLALELGLEGPRRESGAPTLCRCGLAAHRPGRGIVRRSPRGGERRRLGPARGRDAVDLAILDANWGRKVLFFCSGLVERPAILGVVRTHCVRLIGIPSRQFRNCVQMFQDPEGARP